MKRQFGLANAVAPSAGPTLGKTARGVSHPSVKERFAAGENGGDDAGGLVQESASSAKKLCAATGGSKAPAKTRQPLNAHQGIS